MDERDGLRGNVVPHRPLQLHLAVVSMQSTGVYWIAVYDILEAGSFHIVTDTDGGLSGNVLVRLAVELFIARQLRNQLRGIQWTRRSHTGRGWSGSPRFESRQCADLFVHWQLGMTGVFA